MFETSAGQRPLVPNGSLNGISHIPSRFFQRSPKYQEWLWAGDTSVFRPCPKFLPSFHPSSGLPKTAMGLKLSWLLALILNIIDNEPHDDDTEDSKNSIRRQIRKLIRCMTKHPDQITSRMHKISTSIQRRISSMSSAFERDNSSVTFETLVTWTTWVWTEVLVAFLLNDIYIMDIYEMVRHFRRDFDQLLAVAALNYCRDRIGFEFRELSYFTYPSKGQKRWWVDAMVSVVEKEPYWMSEEHKFAQVCMTKGHPKETQDYIPGLVFNRDYLQAWDCGYKCPSMCVKCCTVDEIFRNAFEDFQSKLNELSTALPALETARSNAQNFKLLLMKKWDVPLRSNSTYTCWNTKLN